MSCSKERVRYGDNLPPWRQLIRGARERERRGTWSRWLQLASVACDGTPRVRTLVFRGWSGPAQLDLLSDARTEKITELQQTPYTELCWLLPKARCQFRLRGRVSLSSDDDDIRRQDHWRDLSASGKALWAWPDPGTSLSNNALWPISLPNTTAMPLHFVLIRIDISQVDLLNLSVRPHHRKRWRQQHGWIVEDLNP